jgi:hypothetical protein
MGVVVLPAWAKSICNARQFASIIIGNTARFFRRKIVGEREIIETVEHIAKWLDRI